MPAHPFQAQVEVEAERNHRVDFLRGTAISAVLLLHFMLAFGIKNSPLGDLLPSWLLIGLARNGNYGVTIFFVVSGFLITSTALHRWGRLADIDLRTFYLLRLARIMPTLVLALAIIVTLGSLGIPFFSNTDGGHNLPASHFLLGAGSVLTFWHNVLMQSTGYFNYCLNVFWSLSVEEVFYLAMPLLCITLRRTWLLVAVCTAAIVAGPVYRSQHIGNEIYFMYGYWACFDAIAIGCLTALAAQRFSLPNRFKKGLRIISGLALAGVYLWGIHGNEVAGFSLVALASAGFLFGSHQDASRGWCSARAAGWVRWAGRHSYEIYLFHIVVLAAMRNFATKESLSYAARLPWLALFLCLTALAAALVARHVSEPANRAIRRRFQKS